MLTKVNEFMPGLPKSVDILVKLLSLNHYYSTKLPSKQLMKCIIDESLQQQFSLLSRKASKRFFFCGKY